MLAGSHGGYGESEDAKSSTTVIAGLGRQVTQTSRMAGLSAAVNKDDGTPNPNGGNQQNDGGEKKVENSPNATDKGGPLK